MKPARRGLPAAWLAALLLVQVARPAAAQQPDAHYVDGVTAFNAGDYARSITEMNASMATKPTSKAALYLGNAHLKLGQLGSAKAALQRALDLDPTTPKRAAILQLIKGIEAAQTAKVKVTSTPSGATIIVDSETGADAAAGKTPADVMLTPGSHEITVTLEGYDPEKRVREFKTGEKIAIDVTLQVKTCLLTIRADPGAARAAIDGGEPRPLPLPETRVKVGTHTIALTAAGFEPKELSVECDGGKPLELAPKLVPTTGRVKFSTPPGIAVAVDGRTLSAAEVAEGIALPAGPHEIVFTGGGRAPLKKNIVVAAAQEVAVEAPLLTPEPRPPGAEQTSKATEGFVAPRLYLGAMGGAHVTLIEWNLGTDTRGAYPISSATLGLRVGMQLSPRLAVEGEAQWVGLPNRLDDGLGHGLITDGNVLFHVLRGRWSPIVEAGAGTYQVLSSALGADVDLRLHAGIGLRGRIGDALVVRLDARDVITDGFDKSLGNNLELLLGVETDLWK